MYNLLGLTGDFRFETVKYVIETYGLKTWLLIYSITGAVIEVSRKLISMAWLHL